VGSGLAARDARAGAGGLGRRACLAPAPGACLAPAPDASLASARAVPTQVEAGKTFTEVEVDELLTSRRAAQQGFIEPSFATIAGAPVCHAARAWALAVSPLLAHASCRLLPLYFCCWLTTHVCARTHTQTHTHAHTRHRRRPQRRSHPLPRTARHLPHGGRQHAAACGLGRAV